jgi:hypothetical protein
LNAGEQGEIANIKPTPDTQRAALEVNQIDITGPLIQLLLLLALRMSLFAVLMSGLRVLFGTLSTFFALGMIALAVVFSGGTVCLGCIFVMFGGFVVFVSRHRKPRRLGQSLPAGCKLAVPGYVPLDGILSVRAPPFPHRATANCPKLYAG